MFLHYLPAAYKILVLDLRGFYFEAPPPEMVRLAALPAVCQPRHLTGFDNTAFISNQ